ncbi:hypothetical protein FDG95_gp458 [Pectobacterium phage vB_PcaM_CBB]|uniref:Uncharacterized protein n=1 Tax=Pectobacterium phage vB_PcaM_CBB TaxID=2772511 RepID=A0A1L2CVN7_9CAUD|nr:hypothetical protein FDG95_gp458 [Pectobacterium phage vB_PcaM_CBB]AMM44084.1 hypothetical protein CBB_521 [Pectobacterium phage vB_PcaM_CBB]
MISTSINHESAMRVHGVLKGKPNLFINEELLFEISEATKILIEAYANRNNSRKEYDYYISMVETYLVDYHRTTPEAFVHFIRSITDNNICIRYDDVPYFREIVRMYGPLIRYARCIKWDEYESFEMGVLGA